MTTATQTAIRNSLSQPFLSPTAPLVEPSTGIVTPPWRAFFASLYQRTGGTQGAASSDGGNALVEISLEEPEYWQREIDLLKMGGAISDVPDSPQWPAPQDLLAMIQMVSDDDDGFARLSPIPNDTMLGNISGGLAPPIALTFTQWIDATMGNARGDLLYRGVANWAALPLGATGDVLSSNGVDALWAPLPAIPLTIDWYNVKNYGAVGNGSTDDTAAIQAAISACAGAGGGVVYFPIGNYKTSGALATSAAIIFMGDSPGSSIISPVGASFNAFSFGGSTGAGIQNLRINAGGMSGSSVCVLVSGADRVGFTNIIIDQCIEAFFIENCNVCAIHQVWIFGVTGTAAITYFGTTGVRSDVLDISHVEMSCTSNTIGSTGLVVDGNVATVSARHIACTTMGRGVWVKNSTGGPDCEFVTIYDLQVDFPLDECVRLEGACRSVFLTDLYAHGSANSDGIYIDSTVQNVNIKGGKIDSNWLRGVFCDGRYVHISDIQISNNSFAGSAAWAGVQFGANSIGCSIDNSLVGQWIGYATNQQSYGVQVDAGAQDYAYFYGNNLLNNVHDTYIDSAGDGLWLQGQFTTSIFGTQQYAFIPPNFSPFSFLTSFAVQATTVSNNHIETAGIFTMIANKGGPDIANANDKVCLSCIMECQVGAGDCWSFYPVQVLDAGCFGTSGFVSYIMECDMNNNSGVDLSNPTVINGAVAQAVGIGLTGISGHPCTAAIWITGSGSGSQWDKGIWFTGGASVKSASLFDQSSSAQYFMDLSLAGYGKGPVNWPSAFTQPTAAAGAGGTLPATVQGYLVWYIAGTEFKVPYYPV